MNLAEYDSNRQLADTTSGPVGYIDVGSGRPGLFVHGVGTSGLLWRNVIGALQGERRCIALDLPLHGRTPIRPGQDLSLTGHAKVVEDFCAALDLTGIDLVANDTGVIEVVTIDGGRLFFPDERAADLVPHLRAHWAAHAAV